MNFDTKVKGTSFCQAIIEAMAGNETLVLECDPTNVHDPNAIAVRIADGPCVRTHVGYVPKEMAARLAPRIAGRTVPVTHWIRTGGGEGMSWGLLVFFEVE